MAKLDVQYLIDAPRSARNGGASIISTGGGSSALPDFTLYVKRDGSTPMLGNFDVGGFSVTNVSLIDGIDLPAHVANPNAHHNQTHGIIGSDHTVSASPLQLVGAVSLNTLGIISPLSDATLSVKEAILKTDASGFLKIVKLTTTDSVRTPIIDTATGHLTLSPASDLLLNPGSKLTKIYATHAIQTNGFTSGWTGYGFRLDQDISRSNKSHFEVDDIVVRGRMSVYELLIRQIRATNGSIFVTSSAKIKNVTPISGGYRVSTVASGETSTTDLSHGFLAGDLIRSQRTKWNGSVLAGIYQSDLQVTTVINLYEFDAALVSGDAPSIGMEYVRLGNVSNADRRGSVYLTADDTNAPFIDVVDGISSHSLWNSSGAVKVRIGKLTGITGQADAYGIFSGNSAATWQSMETLNGFRIGYSGTTRLKIDALGNLNIFNSSGSPVITLENSGLSYFSGVMTIGENGEIRQGTGTFGSNWTGLRIWNDAGKGRIGGYKSNVLQWYADTNGELRSGGGVVGLSADGLSLTRYITEGIGTPVAGTESTAAISWWDDINNRTGQTPISRIYAARDAIGVGGIPSLVFEVDQSNSNINKRPAIWLSSSGASLAPELWFVNVYSIIGIPGIFPQRTFGTTNTRVDFSGGLYFGSHILRLPATSDIDIGTVGNPFRTIYAQNIVATSTTGAAISGSIWQNDAADMYIRSNSASNRTLYIANPGTGSMNLDVEMNITLGGTVDGVDISGFYTAYQAHTHSHSSLSGITADQHHPQSHAYDSADHTGSLSWSNVSKVGSSLTDIVVRPHSSLTGIGPNDHHSQTHAFDSADHTGSLSWSKVSKVGSNLLDLETRNYSNLNNRTHGIISADHSVTGATYQIIGLVSTNTLGLLTPSSSPASNEIIKTDSSNRVTLINLTTTNAILANGGVDFGVNTIVESGGFLQFNGGSAINFNQKVQSGTAWSIATNGSVEALTAQFSGSVSIISGGDLSVAGSGAYSGLDVLKVSSSGGNIGINCTPDSQFSLDVAGPARAQYFVGPHAIQLKDVLLLSHFDGRTPFETNFSGETNGHMGQVASVFGGVIFRSGKFGKAIQISPAATNLIVNPSFETGTTGWTWVDANASAATPAITNVYGHYHTGERSLRLSNTVAGENDYMMLNVLNLLPNTSYTISAWCRVVSFSGPAFGSRGLVAYDFSDVSTLKMTTITGVVDEWVRHTVTVTTTATPGDHTIQIRLYSPFAYVVWDSVQCEVGSSATPYLDGSLGGYSEIGVQDGSGHSWSGTAHASTSSRLASQVLYPTSGNILSNKWTIMAWVNPSSITTGGNQTILRINGTGSFLILRLQSGQLQGWAGTSQVNGGVIPANTWTHVAASYDGETVKLYINGVLSASGSSSGFSGMPSLMYIGCNGAADVFNGLIDDLTILSYPINAILLRSIYESNAPVFAETSRYVFRATPKGLVWADDQGLWVKDATGKETFGVYGGDSPTKTWGGVNLEPGDVLMGRGSNYVHFDSSAGTMIFSGNGQNLTSINGGNIQTGTIQLSSLNFTPALTSNIVASINASSEGIRISANKIQIDGTVVFASGYNPTTKADAAATTTALAGKIPTGGAASDVNAGTTTISGGKITANSVTLSYLDPTSGTKLNGIQAGATVGATWGVNLDVPSNFEAPTNGVPGLHSTPDRIGFWNGTIWKMWMNSSGQFYFGGDSEARLQWDGTTLAGYNASNAVQWAASSVTGMLTAGAGNVELNELGIEIAPNALATAINFKSVARINSFYDAGFGGTLSIEAGYGLPKQSSIFLATYTGTTLASSVSLRPNGNVEVIGGLSASGAVSASAIGLSTGNIYSATRFALLTSDGSAYQSLYYSTSVNNSGIYYSNLGHHSFHDFATGAYVKMCGGGLLTSNDSNHTSRIPTNGIYSLGGVAIGTPGEITAGYLLDVNGSSYMRGTVVIGGLQYLAAQSSASAPAIATNGVATFVVLHSTNNRRYVIAYNENGTVKYRWLDLNAVGTPVWNYSTNWNNVID